VLPAALPLPVSSGKDQQFFIHDADLRFFDIQTGKSTEPRPIGPLA
jgi:hypothetical protein